MQGDLIAALHLESSFNVGQRVGDKINRATYLEPAIHYSDEHDAVQLRHRLAFIQSLAVRAQGPRRATWEYIDVRGPGLQLFSRRSLNGQIRSVTLLNLFT